MEEKTEMQPLLQRMKSIKCSCLRVQRSPQSLRTFGEFESSHHIVTVTQCKHFNCLFHILRSHRESANVVIEESSNLRAIGHHHINKKSRWSIKIGEAIQLQEIIFIDEHNPRHIYHRIRIGTSLYAPAANHHHSNGVLWTHSS